MRIRTFFALRLAEPVVRQLADQADDLCANDRNLEVDWVDSDHYHLTLCFIGDTALDTVDQLEALAKEHLCSETSFQICLDRIEYYPINPELSLIAALPPENEHLENFQKKVASVVEAAGVKSDPADFRPHITLGKLPRKNKFQPPESWPALDLYSLADSVVLFQSKQGEHGSVYTPLFEVDLQDLS
ncbi:RNA 2',3'-cyclic phosphodiesterase [Neptunomonas sp.]|uniref:RNA 2',3'-cyclic phosphodiesterase n=1 Tax=Neptunomonas TaxID=75687 RepID=UPI003517B4EC